MLVEKALEEIEGQAGIGTCEGEDTADGAQLQGRSLTRQNKSVEAGMTPPGNNHKITLEKFGKEDNGHEPADHNKSGECCKGRSVLDATHYNLSYPIQEN